MGKRANVNHQILEARVSGSISRKFFFQVSKHDVGANVAFSLPRSDCRHQRAFDKTILRCLAIELIEFRLVVTALTFCRLTRSGR
jgi:hypothetical protein